MKRSLEKRIVDWEVYLKNLNVDLLKANIIGERDGWLRSLRVVEEFVWMCGFIEHIWKASWRNGLLIEKYIEEFELVDLFNAYEKILGETDCWLKKFIEEFECRLCRRHAKRFLVKQIEVLKNLKVFEGVKRGEKDFFKRKDRCEGPGCWRICLNVDLLKR